MKKLLVMFTLLFVPLAVFAAEEPKVLTVTAEVEGSTIKYKGTTEDGITAVMCKLFDTTENAVDQLSSAVDAKTFEAAFENVEKGTYKVACARYEGGDFVTSEEVAVETVAPTNNPQTYDSGILTYIIILVVSVAFIVGAVIFLKKKKRV